MADGQTPLTEPLAQRLNRRMGHLKNDRSSWEPHWRELADMFVENFKKYEDRVSDAVRNAGPRPG